MALQEYVGAVVLEVDGQEIECTSFSEKINTGRQPVKTMNRKRKIAGYSTGIETYELTVAVPIPVGKPNCALRTTSPSKPKRPWRAWKSPPKGPAQPWRL